MPFQGPIPSSLSDLQSIVASSTPESIHLDYKASLALASQSQHKDISKDVSAFLNSDGGLLIYGIEEQGHLPVSIDSGVDHDVVSRERLEQLILGNIAPRPTGIEIKQIPLSASHSAFAVLVPRGTRVPYQDSKSGRYYRRYNFQSVPMEHFEIEDLRQRRWGIDRLVNVDIELRHGILVYVVIENPGALPASDVRFTFSPQLIWSRRQTAPPLIEHGAKVLPPGRRYLFLYDSYIDLVQPNSQRAMQFTVSVQYRHPAAESEIEDAFTFDLDDYRESAIVRGDVAEAADAILGPLKNIHDDLQKLTSKVESLAAIAHPSGLALSASTLRNLTHVRNGDPAIEKLYVAQITIGLFQEALGVPFDLAYRLYHYWLNDLKSPLEDIEGITPELASRIRELLPDRGV